jgi:hypothetical protein
MLESEVAGESGRRILISFIMDTQTKRRKSQEDSSCNITFDGSFPRFLIIESNGSKSLTELSPFIKEKQLSALIGTPTSVKKLRNGGLLIEVERKQQSDIILKCSSFFNIGHNCHTTSVSKL